MSNQRIHSHSHFAGACDLFKQAHNISHLAESIGMSSHVLHNKFNPACERHNLTAQDLIAPTTPPVTTPCLMVCCLIAA